MGLLDWLFGKSTPAVMSQVEATATSAKKRTSASTRGVSPSPTHHVEAAYHARHGALEKSTVPGSVGGAFAGSSGGAGWRPLSGQGTSRSEDQAMAATYHQSSRMTKCHFRS